MLASFRYSFCDSTKSGFLCPWNKIARICPKTNDIYHVCYFGVHVQVKGNLNDSYSEQYRIAPLGVAIFGSAAIKLCSTKIVFLIFMQINHLLNRITLAQMAARLLHDQKVVGLNLAGSNEMCL